ncbi:class II aldolase/adducin family protein [Pseudonocardia acaciae]|uniref:class II aldolase/adducin family protein n=1 Tax=Pseudonocardia acaciae TaxID=551276 RepID=UPI000688A841|nr:class II aldolase/adducin family protein [Pseudonocardia acaciae]
MTGPNVAEARRGLVRLSHQLGDPAADLAILGEGNTSAALGDGSFLVKASGATLGRITEDDLVRLDHAEVLALVDDPTLDDHDVAALSARLAASHEGKPASIETMLHALALDLPGVRVVGHTHPTAVNALLCSDRAADLVAGSLFPDQVVVCGAHALLVPYAEPGLPLARAVRRGLAAHVDEHGAPPRLVHLANHGIVALGENAAQVLAVTAMAVKAARILSGALAVGAPRYLDPETVRRLDTRADERHRRAMLSLREDR